MELKSETSKVREFQGEKLQPAIDYSYDWKVFEGVTEAKEAGQWPNESDVLKMVNRDSKISAKSKSYQEATKALQEAFENTPEYKRRELVKALKLSGFSDEQAGKMADDIGNQ